MFSKLIMGVCAVSMLSSACTTRNASQQRAENELTMLVGTYTSGNSKGIYTFRFILPYRQITVSFMLSANRTTVRQPSMLFPSIRRTGRSNC